MSELDYKLKVSDVEQATKLASDMRKQISSVDLDELEDRFAEVAIRGINFGRQQGAADEREQQKKVILFSETVMEAIREAWDAGLKEGETRAGYADWGRPRKPETVDDYLAQRDEQVNTTRTDKSEAR